VAKKAAAKTAVKSAGKPVKGKNAASAKSAAGAKRMTKSAIFTELAQKTSLTKAQVATFFDALFDLIKREVGPGGYGEFVVPNSIIKVRRARRKAQPEKKRTDPRDPTKEITIKARPEHEVVKVSAMKTLKDLLPKP
jgi:nucleoid DNA-binding protein